MKDRGGWFLTEGGWKVVGNRLKVRGRRISYVVDTAVGNRLKDEEGRKWEEGYYMLLIQWLITDEEEYYMLLIQRLVTD